MRDVLPARQNGAANESNADSSASNPPVDTNASATVGFAAASANDRSAASTSASLRSTNRRIASSIFVESHADPSVMVHSARARASCVARVSNAARAATFANETCHGRYLAWPVAVSIRIVGLDGVAATAASSASRNATATSISAPRVSPRGVPPRTSPTYTSHQ